VILFLPKQTGLLPCVTQMWGRLSGYIQLWNEYQISSLIMWTLLLIHSKRVVDFVNSHVDDDSEFGCIIFACKELLLNRFQNFHVEFNRRHTNEVNMWMMIASLVV